MNLRAISLFTGVGGLDFGFEAAGFETVAALDADAVACRAIKSNRHWPVIEGDIARIRSREILDVAGLVPGQADVLIGGPPCQPFSKSGYWANGDARRLDDPRAGTLGQYLRVLRDCLPKAFLLENVSGLAYLGKSEGLEFIKKGIASINADIGTNYVVQTRSLNAADHGVPQLRERVVLVGFRDGTGFEFPEPTHAVNAVSQSGLEPHRTAWDAIGDLPADPNDPDLEMTGKWADLLSSIPEGDNYLWHTPRGGGNALFGWRTRYWSFLLKLAKNRSAWTIQAQPGPATGPFHWRNRKLSALELARLQTFPSGLQFNFKRGDVQRLIGNAVPSALAEALALKIRAHLSGERVNGRPTLVPESRGNPPPAEPIAQIPAKYHSLVGDHAEHPGTGKGRRAAQRLAEATP
jgi:DNA (cytosine-5)-methyltransferase 1